MSNDWHWIREALEGYREYKEIIRAATAGIGLTLLGLWRYHWWHQRRLKDQETRMNELEHRLITLEQGAAMKEEVDAKLSQCHDKLASRMDIMADKIFAKIDATNARMTDRIIEILKGH